MNFSFCKTIFPLIKNDAIIGGPYIFYEYAKQFHKISNPHLSNNIVIFKPLLDTKTIKNLDKNLMKLCGDDVYSVYYTNRVYIHVDINWDHEYSRRPMTHTLKLNEGMTVSDIDDNCERFNFVKKLIKNKRYCSEGLSGFDRSILEDWTEHDIKECRKFNIG